MPEINPDLRLTEEELPLMKQQIKLWREGMLDPKLKDGLIALLIKMVYLQISTEE